MRIRLYATGVLVGTVVSLAIPAVAMASTHHHTNTNTNPVTGVYQWCGNPDVVAPCSDTSPHNGIRVKLASGYSTTIQACDLSPAGQECFTYQWVDPYSSSPKLYHTIYGGTQSPNSQPQFKGQEDDPQYTEQNSSTYSPPNYMTPTNDPFFVVY